MAQGDKFEFGVAYPIANHKFRHPTFYEATLISYIAGSTQTTWVFQNSVNEGVCVQRGDLFTITNSSGTTETFTVLNTAYSYPTLTVFTKNAPTATFTASDVAKFAGSRLAGAWSRSGTTTSSSDETNRVEVLTTKPYTRLPMRTFAQAFRTGATQNGNAGIVQALDVQKFNPLTFYRLSFTYRVELFNSSGSAQAFWLFNDGAGLRSNTISIGGDQLSWTEYNTSLLIRGQAVSSGGSLGFYVQKANANDNVTFWVKDVVLEHAANVEPEARIRQAVNAGGSIWGINVYDLTSNNLELAVNDSIFVSRDNESYAFLIVTGVSGDTLLTIFSSGSTGALVQDARLIKVGSGVYTMQDHCIQPSIDYELVDTTALQPLSNNSLRLVNQMSDGDRGHRWTFQCRWTTINQTDWNALQMLLNWQSRGHLLTFHPNIDDLPPVMVGYLRIRNVRKQTSWSLTYRDFDMIFIEAKL